MSIAYRDVPLTCPACADPLAPEAAGEAVIDLCPTCGGVWIDWHDGELTEMIRRAPALTAPTHPAGGGSSACPRCQAPLVPERYGSSEAEILRCADCIGAFVPRAAIAIVLVGTAPSSARDGEKSFFARLLARLRALTSASP